MPSRWLSRWWFAFVIMNQSNFFCQSSWSQFLSWSYDLSLFYCAYQTQIQMLSMLNDNQQCWFRNVQLWLKDQGVEVLYANIKCAIASAHASYLESTYGEQAKTKSSRLCTYQLMNTSCTTESGYSYAHQRYLQVITNVQLKQSLSRFKCSNHRLEVKCGRHAKPESVPRRDRICRLCSLGVLRMKTTCC